MDRPPRDMDRPPRDTERPQREREPRRSGAGYGEGRPQRGRRRPDRGQEVAERRPIEEPAEESAAPKVETPRISPDVVARDLSRVSAQLREPPRREEREPDMIEPPAFDLEAASGSDEESIAIGRRDVDDELPEFESDLSESQEDSFDGSDSGESVDADRSAESSDERSASAESESADSPEASFGRARHFRGAALRKSENTEIEPPKEPTEDLGTSGFSNEEASFGRLKRKRTRK